MKSFKILLLILGLTALAAGLGVIYRLPPVRDAPGAVLRLGVPEGAPALLAMCIAQRSPSQIATRLDYDLNVFADCCSSSTEMALAAGEVDMAVLCPEAARRLLEKDESYMLAGPWMSNTDVIVVRDQAHPPVVAVASGRSYQEAIARKAFGPDCEIKRVNANARAYAYEIGQAGAVVIDITKAGSLSGQTLPGLMPEGEDNASLLVVRKELAGTPEYQHFVEVWRACSVDLQTDDKLEQALDSYGTQQGATVEVDEWRKMEVMIYIPRP